MLKFLLLDYLGVSSQRMETLFTFCKYLHYFRRLCVKYANEVTDDIIHSTNELYIKYINTAILAILQHRPLKLDRLIVLQKTNLSLKSSVPMATDSFLLLVLFSSKTLNKATNSSLVLKGPPCLNKDDFDFNSS